MWTDAETNVDYLNYCEVAELIAELIADPNLLPLSVGVFGGWGIGKSSTLNLVENELNKKADAYLIVRFDAWLYQDFDDARAALMSVIASTLIAASPPSLKEKAKNLLARVDKLRLLGLLAEGGAALMGIPTFGATARAIQAAGDWLAGNADDDDKAAAVGAVKELKAKGSGLIAKAESKEPPEEIAAFRKEFAEVLNGLDRTLVVFIDNLDRCLPANAIQTLEAIRLFLFLPKTAFVIAADEDMVRHAVAQHFNSPGERHVTDYLDKLIQMPVFVPRAGVLEVRAYLVMLQAARTVSDQEKLDGLRSSLISQLQKAWSEDVTFSVDDILKVLDREQDAELRRNLEMADRMAPMLALSSRVNGNPRIVKRLMNVVRMRSSIAKKREMPLDEGVIAKLALLERCTDSLATEALHHAINFATNGKPDLLRDVEAAESEAELKQACPDAWQKHLSVVQDWVRLEPKLAGIDLRPAVYLARETVPLRLTASSLSSAAKHAIQELLQTGTVSSVVAKEAVAALDPAEHVTVMDQLVSEMRKNSDWEKTRPDVRGAVVLARASASAGAVFSRFIVALPKRPKWLNALIKDESWFSE